MLRPNTPHGFTLTEMLVVVAIIAVLLAIFVPALNRARESARRAQCMAHQRGIFLAFAELSLDRRGRVPMGYSYTKQFNYPVNVVAHNVQQLGPIGLLYVEDYLGGPEMIVCPSNRHPQFSRFRDGGGDTSTELFNQWPLLLTKHAKVRNTRSCFGVRPVEDLSIDSNAPQGIDLVEDRFVRWPDYADRAVMADIVSGAKWVDDTHLKGVNVTYGDGAVRWIDRDLLDFDLEAMTYSFSSSNDRFMLTDDQAGGVFAELDAAR